MLFYLFHIFCSNQLSSNSEGFRGVIKKGTEERQKIKPVDEFNDHYEKMCDKLEGTTKCKRDADSKKNKSIKK